RKEVLDIATTEAAHRKILTGLGNPDQQAIVAAPQEGNCLVLAGPGAGKTRVIVHRVAWLLRECLVLPEEIMVLAYNRSAAVEIRRRLWALVGSDAAGVTVQTLHGLAMRLTGTSYAVAVERGEAVNFAEVIQQATARLQAAEQGDGVGPSVMRDRLLAGLRFLLVDEYQDINGDHYALISALAGRTLQTEEDRLSLMVVGDDDQNIYAFDGANVRYIRQFEADYQARRFALVENYRSTAHIIHCANRVIAPARERMKAGQEIRVDHARRGQPDGGAQAALDPLAAGRVQVLEVPRDLHREVCIALAELQRLHALDRARGTASWGGFAVIARRWEDLEPMAALCRQHHVPVQLLRDGSALNLHLTREGHALLELLRGALRRAARRRVVLRAGTLGRWFRRRHGMPVDGAIAHPFNAALAQFIVDTESAAPGCPRVAADLVDALYEFGAGTRAPAAGRPNAPLLLMTAHRAKGLEFEHVLVLDGGGWQGRNDDERRLFYVAMTRARRSLTLCEVIGGPHPFTRELNGLSLRVRPEAPSAADRLDTRVWLADPGQVVLSWPGRFAPSAPVHRALAALDVGSPLRLQARADGRQGWELADEAGLVVTRLAKSFAPPAGDILAVRVAAILVRHAREGEAGLHCRQWELVLPEIEYRPGGG
ncbi:MAG TPA: ATP-dependent helicase, partial [Zoogloea sp.]|nr:ATP-dependent helicase [Zoogloea sp.]